MLIRALILSVLAVAGVNADCVCYNTQPMLTGSKATLSNAYQSTDYSTCYSAPCGFLAYSGSPTVGWSNIKVTFSTIGDATGNFKIYNGNTSDPNTLIATYTTANSGNDMYLTSSTPFVYIVYSQTDKTNPNAYYGSISANGGLAAPTTTAAPTAAPTTRPFNNPLFAKDPWLISHDIMVMVNQKTDQGAAGLNALNSLAKQFVDLLSITNNNQSESQSRLGLATVTPYSPYYSAQGEIWSMTANDVKGALPQSGVSIVVDIKTALTKVASTFFLVNDPAAATRKNVQRSIILFTAWWGDYSQTLDDEVKGIFDTYGVNLAIVGYNTNSDQLVSTSWYNYVSLTNTTDKDVADFVNRFYLNSGYNNNYINNWCKKSADPVYNATGAAVTEPSNYVGPPVVGTAWTSTFDGQKSRYCNFQDTTYTYNRNDTTKLVGITVNYELEVEQDYLKFYADGVEVESFTGKDVNNAYFTLDSNVTTARFTTDSSGVQRGFYVQFKEV